MSRAVRAISSSIRSWPRRVSPTPPGWPSYTNTAGASVCGWYGVEMPPISARSHSRWKGNSEMIPCSAAWIPPLKACSPPDRPSPPSVTASRVVGVGRLVRAVSVGVTGPERAHLGLDVPGTGKYSAFVRSVVSGRSSTDSPTTRRSPCLSDEPRDLLRDGHVRESDRHVRAGRQLAFAEIRVHDDVLLGERLGVVIGPRRLQFGHIAVEVEIRDLVSSALLVVDRSRVRVAERVPEPERGDRLVARARSRSGRSRGPRRSGGSRPAAGSTTRRVSTGSRRRPPAYPKFPRRSGSATTPGNVSPKNRSSAGESQLSSAAQSDMSWKQLPVLGVADRPPAAPRRNRSGCASGTDQAGLRRRPSPRAPGRRRGPPAPALIRRHPRAGVAVQNHGVEPAHVDAEFEGARRPDTPEVAGMEVRLDLAAPIVVQGRLIRADLPASPRSPLSEVARAVGRVLLRGLSPRTSVCAPPSRGRRTPASARVVVPAVTRSTKSRLLSVWLDFRRPLPRSCQSSSYPAGSTAPSRAARDPRCPRRRA